MPSEKQEPLVKEYAQAMQATIAAFLNSAAGSGKFDPSKAEETFQSIYKALPKPKEGMDPQKFQEKLQEIFFDALERLFFNSRVFNEKMKSQAGFRRSDEEAALKKRGDEKLPVQAENSLRNYFTNLLAMHFDAQNRAAVYKKYLSSFLEDGVVNKAGYKAFKESLPNIIPARNGHMGPVELTKKQAAAEVNRALTEMLEEKFQGQAVVLSGATVGDVIKSARKLNTALQKQQGVAPISPEVVAARFAAMTRSAQNPSNPSQNPQPLTTAFSKHRAASTQSTAAPTKWPMVASPQPPQKPRSRKI